MADARVNIAQRAKHLDSAGMAGSAADVREIAQGARRMLRNSLKAYAAEDSETARMLLAEDAAIDAFYGELIRKLAVAASRSPELMSTHLDVLSIAKNLERIADHATNIAEDVIFLHTGEIVRHNRQSISADAGTGKR